MQALRPPITSKITGMILPLSCLVTSGIPFTQSLNLLNTREQLDYGLEAPSPKLDLDSPPHLNIQGPNQWPRDASLPNFRSTTLAFMNALCNIAARLMKAMAMSLELPEGFFDGTFGEMPHVRMKIVR